MWGIDVRKVTFLLSVAISLSVSGAAIADDGSPKNGTFLNPTKAYDGTMLKTAKSANWHQRTVSIDGIKNVKPALEKAGWTLIGKVVEPSGIKDGRAYVAVDEARGNVVVSFRGSGGEKWWETGSNAITDLNTLRTKVDWIEKHQKGVRVHKGFSNEYLRFRDQILNKVRKHKDKRIFVTGFSLGAGLAQLCALDIKLNTGAARVFLYPHASPRVGGKDFRALLESNIKRIDRVVLNGDPITQLPPKPLPFQHAGRVLILTLDGHRLSDHRPGITPGNHNYDLYKTALKKHEALCAKECKKDALKKAADTTR
jgi:hypothetical protein